MNIERLRAETPGCRERIHLNNAGAALMPACVVHAVQEHIALESRIGGYEAADARRESLLGAYDAVAELLGTRPGNIAFAENATAAYSQALSSIPFERGDVILTTRNDYASNQIQFLSLQARTGIEIVRAPDRAEGGVDVEAIEEMISRHRPRIVCVTHVPTSSGLIQDVRSIGALCRREEILYLVDACQSVGQMPVDVYELGCDFLSSNARKFLRGPRGVGFLFVSDRVLEAGLAPLFIDMRGAEWIADDRYRIASTAQRFETFECAPALLLGAGEAARYANSLGLGAIRDRVRALAKRLRTRLGAIDGARVLDRGEELCGIVSVRVDGRDPADLVAALRERGINASAQTRAFALLDYDDKGVAAALRTSPHYYNTEDEIDCAAAVLEELLAE